MELKVIAYARNGHTDKFGIPRQSRDESPILTRIVFEPEYRIPEALRGIEGYSHLWLIWGFSRSFSSHTSSSTAWQEVLGDARSPQKLEIVGDPNKLDWSPTVRPPRLGGNKRMGVFATRSPYRPNALGMSSVRLVGVEMQKTKAANEGVKEESRMVLVVSGADVLDGTPIYDVKPYLSFTDSHPDAVNGFAEETKNRTLAVELCTRNTLDETTLNPRQSSVNDIQYILSHDPRPAYQDDPTREYKMDYAGLRVTFSVKKDTVLVKNIEKI